LFFIVVVFKLATNYRTPATDDYVKPALRLLLSRLLRLCSLWARGCNAHFAALQVSDVQIYTSFFACKIFLQAFYAT
jgi:hypothetical protein